MSFEKQAIFSLIDVSGSMEDAYSKNYSNSKIESLTETIRNIIFSENLLGSEKDIDFYSLIFGASKLNDWLNALVLLNIAINNNDFKYFDIENVKSDPKYYCYNPIKEIIKLLNDKGAIDIDRYIYNLPSEDYLHVLVYYLKRDRDLLEEVYQRLPECHKKIEIGFRFLITNTELDYIFVPLQFIGKVAEGLGKYSKNSSYRIGAHFVDCKKEIKEHYDFVVNKVKEIIIEEKIDKKAIKEITGDSIYNLRKKLSSFFNSSSKKKNFLKGIETIIYGDTPMNEVFIDLFDFINKNNLSYKNKVIFLLSDGVSSDGNPTNNVINQLKITNSYLISCFLSSEEQDCPKKLYGENEIPNNLTKGEKILFEMSSIISTVNPFFHYLEEEKGWDIPKEGKCKLFVRLNDPNILDEYLSIITTLVKDNDALFDLIGKINFQQYIINNINSFIPIEQNGPTCWAYAIATVIHMSLNRIYKKKIPSFEKIKDDLIDNYKKEKGNIKKILTKILPKYKLHFKKVKEIDAKYAIQKGRPCVFSFLLDKRGWEKFLYFYQNYKSDILTKEKFDNINAPILDECKTIGHAVVFFKYNSYCMEFINSSKSLGFFKIGDLSIFKRCHFYDIYWDLSDLTEEDKKNWEERNQELVKDNLYKEGLFNYKIQCPNCKKISEAKQFNGNFYKAICPLCNFSFVPNIEQLAKTLYLKQKD